MKKILVIDDDMRYRDVFLPYLQSYGFEVVEAGTIKDGLRLVASTRFDLAIVDGMLPDGSGVDAIKTIRSSGNDIPLVFISGVVKDQATAEMLRNELSVSFVKPKPIVPDEICREILELFRKQSQATARQPYTGDKTRPPALLPQQPSKSQAAQIRPSTPFELSQAKAAAAKKLETAEQDYVGELPLKIAQIREKIETAMRSPGLVDFSDLLLQVHNIKGTAGMHGLPQIGRVMERIESHLKLLVSGREASSDDSLIDLAQELRKLERERS